MYHIRLYHQILSDHGVFYPQALYNNLIFELTLAPASQVVKGSDPTNLKYKLTNIQLEYEMICSKTKNEHLLQGQEFAYDHVTCAKVVPLKKDSGTRINITVNIQRRSLKAILLLHGSPNMLYNNRIEGKDIGKRLTASL